MNAGDSSPREYPGKSRNLRFIPIIVVIALALLGFYAYTILPRNQTGSTELPRSGPISRYPAAWGIYSSCPGFSKQGNTTTLNGLTSVSYPNSWNTTTIVTLAQVYDSIIDSSAFAGVASGHGWVVYSWFFVQGGSNNPFSNGDTIVGFFILTNGVSPNGYVTAYYDIQNGDVSIGSLTTTVTVVCPSFTSG